MKPSLKAVLKSGVELSFIIPFSPRKFLTNDNSLKYLIELLVKLPNCEVVIDYQGPIDKDFVNLASIYKQLKIITSKGSTNQTYSPGLARNRAVEHACGEYLFFIDADLICDVALLKQLVARCRKLADIGPQAFEMFPCFYLTEQETQSDSLQFDHYLASYLSGQINRVENIALASSCLLVNKHWFIKLGGFDTDFVGHGGEDLTLIHQLALHYPIAELPSDYSDNIKSPFPASYQGFRRYFSLYALAHLFTDRFFVHLWHPRPLTNLYHKKRAGNDVLLVKKLKECSTGFSVMDENNIKQLQASCLIDANLLVNLETGYHPWLISLQEKYGYPVSEFPGLFSWTENSVKKYSIKRKLRKLYLHPRLFFADIKK